MFRVIVPLIVLALTLVACQGGQPKGHQVDDGEGVGATSESPADIVDPASTFQPVSQRVEVEDCPNCNDKMMYEPRGPRPYQGMRCPVCESHGRIWGTLDWEDGYYVAPGWAATRKKAPGGRDRLMARRGAEISAIRNAVRLAASIRLDEGNLLGVRSGEIRIDAFVRGHQATSEKWFADSGEPWCRKQVKVPMHGVGGLNASVIQVVSSSYQRSASVYQSRGTVVLTEEVTHIVIDARELSVGPAFAAKILTENGEIVYDLKIADPEAVRSEGLMKYYFSDAPLDFGLLRRRFGRYAYRLQDEPLLVAALDPTSHWLAQRRKRRRRKRWKPIVVKASRAGQGKKCDVLVSKKDAERIAAANKKSGTLRKANVVIVVGTRVAGKRGRRTPGVRYARLR